MRGIVILLAASLWAQRSLPPTDSAWAPKPAKPPAYRAPHRPHTKMLDVVKRHVGQADWREVVVNDNYMRAAYVQMKPGGKLAKRFHPETRIWWVILDGEVRFEIEGAEPFVATRGSMVQVPLQTLYSMETQGSKPSLRFEVEIAGARTLYPRENDTPPGSDFVPVKLGRRKSVWGEGNRPHVSIADLVRTSKPDERGLSVQQIVKDDRGAMNFIYGSEKDLAPAKPGDKGHYHPECQEFWLIAAGQMSYKIEGQPLVIASFGDVVYVPEFTYHLPRFYGPDPACRLSLNGYPYISHLYE